MKKWIIISLFFMLFTGCSSTMKTAPWDSDDTQRHMANDVQCVPIFEVVW